MAKVNISRLFEVSRYLATPAGAQLKDALEYISSFATETVRTLKQGLTFGDNFDAEIKFISVLNNVETVVMPTKKGTVSQVMIRRVVDNVYYVVDKYGWKYNPSGDVVVKIVFDGSPPSTTLVNVELLIFF
jgi:hypothetical protein